MQCCKGRADDKRTATEKTILTTQLTSLCRLLREVDAGVLGVVQVAEWILLANKPVCNVCKVKAVHVLVDVL